MNIYEMMLREGEGTGGGAAPSTPATPSTPDAGAAPTSTPATPSEPSAPTESADDRPEGDETFEGLGLEELEITPSAEATAPATPEAAPAAPAAATEADPAAAPAEPPVDPNAPPAAPTPQEQAPADEVGASLPLAEPQTIAAAFEANAATMIDALSRDYALTEEEAIAFEANPVQALPRLAATVHHRVVTAAMRQMSQIIPAMVERLTEAKQRSSENQDKFYKAWPALKDPKYAKTVKQIAATYRQMNPLTTLDDMIRAVGPMAMHACGVPMTNGAPATPALPRGVSPNGLQPAGNGQTSPVFSPAVAAPTPSVPTPPEADEWSGLGQELD